MFGVKIVQLVEVLSKDRKYGIGPAGGYGAVGDRVCDQHKKIIDVMSSLTFFIIIICFP